jgi:hypothetical protein
MMAVARRMHAKLVRKDLYAAFDRWDEHTREKKKLRSVALKVTRRMAQRYLAGSRSTDGTNTPARGRSSERWRSR